MIKQVIPVKKLTMQMRQAKMDINLPRASGPFETDPKQPELTCYIAMRGKNTCTVDVTVVASAWKKMKSTSSRTERFVTSSKKTSGQLIYKTHCMKGKE